MENISLMCMHRKCETRSIFWHLDVLIAFLLARLFYFRTSGPKVLVDNGKLSFPSGHSANSFASGVYVILLVGWVIWSLIYVRIKMTLHYVLYSAQEITYLQRKPLTHFCWSDPHKICCIVLGFFSEIKFKI